MKQLRTLKLNKLSDDFLNEQEMNILRGGGTPGNCNCGCGYANHGGSESPTNDAANDANGYSESYGGGDTGSTNNPPERPSCSDTSELNTNRGCWEPVNCNTVPNKC